MELLAVLALLAALVIFLIAAFARRMTWGGWVPLGLALLTFALLLLQVDGMNFHTK